MLRDQGRSQKRHFRLWVPGPPDKPLPVGEEDQFGSPAGRETGGTRPSPARGSQNRAVHAPHDAINTS